MKLAIYGPLPLQKHSQGHVGVRYTVNVDDGIGNLHETARDALQQALDAPRLASLGEGRYLVVCIFYDRSNRIYQFDVTRSGWRITDA